MASTSPASPPASQLASRFAPAVVGVIVAALGGWAWSQNPVGYDDSYIVYQYAQNWVDGNGLVFNPGERVEGFSDPLWVAGSAAAIALGLDPFVAMRSIGVASYLAAIGLIAFALGRHARALGFAGFGLLPALACLVLPDGLAAMSGSGLETSFVALCLVAIGLLCLLPDQARLVRVLGPTLPLLALWTRFDAFIGLCAIALTDFFRSTPTEFVEARRRLLWRIGPSAIGLVVLFGGRFLYYGEWLPNTYYAKGANEWQIGAGLAYLGAFAQSAWQLLPLLGLSVFGALAGHSMRVRRLCIYALLCAGAYTLYLTKVGGDFMHYRFAWTPYLLLSMGGLAGLSELARRQQAVATMFAIAIGLMSATPAVLEDDYTMQSLAQMGAYTELGREVGLALHESLPPDTLIATTLGGTISYYSRLHVVDQWGLNDYEVARGPSLDRFQRGHYKPASTEYLLRRGVEMVLGHPEVCPCDDLCVDPVPMLFLKIGENRCVRSHLLVPKRRLIALACGDAERFRLHRVDCSKL